MYHFVVEGDDYQVVDVRDGIRLFYTKNPMNDLFSLTMGIDFGSRENNKLIAASLLLDKAGTLDLSPDELKQAWKSPANPAPVLGMTGPGGGGKSSLTDELLNRLCRSYADIQVDFVECHFAKTELVATAALDSTTVENSPT